MILKDSIEIKAPPDIVFEKLLWFMKDKESYKSWHPEHVNIKWIKGDPRTEGSVMYIEEYLQDVLHKLKFRIKKVVPNELFSYSVPFPLSIIAPGNKFILEEIGENKTLFTAIGKINMPKWLFLGVHKYHKVKLAATIKHMREEGENIKKVLEEDLNKN